MESLKIVGKYEDLWPMTKKEKVEMCSHEFFLKHALCDGH